MAHKTIRIEESIFNKAQDASVLNSRSISGQVEHWMNIGRILEKSPSVDIERVEAALRAERALDDLTAEETEIFHDKFFAMMGETTEAEEDFYAKLGEKGRAAGYTGE